MTSRDSFRLPTFSVNPDSRRRSTSSSYTWMRAIEFITTVITVLGTIALLHRTDVTTAVMAAYRIVGTAPVRRWPQRRLFAVVDVRHLRFYLISLRSRMVRPLREMWGMLRCHVIFKICCFVYQRGFSVDGCDFYTRVSIVQL